MKRKIFNLILLTILISSCSRDKINGNQIITFYNNGDTNLVKKTYEDFKITYIVQYRNNSPFSNYCYTNDGDTAKGPYLFCSENNKKIFVYIPFGKFINNAQLLISPLDSNSITSKDTLFYGIVSTGDTISIKSENKPLHLFFWGKNIHGQIEAFDYNRDINQK